MGRSLANLASLETFEQRELVDVEAAVEKLVAEGLVEQRSGVQTGWPSVPESQVIDPLYALTEQGRRALPPPR